MKGFTRGVSLPLILLSLYSPGLFAAGIEHLIMSPEGHRIDVKAGESAPEGSRTLKSKVLSTCPEAPGKACIKWKLAIAPNANPNDYLPSIVTALNLITNNTSLNVSFFYNGTTNYGGPIFSDPDSFQNPTVVPEVAGNFLISTQPPAEISFGSGVVSTSRKYIVPNLETNEGDIQWGGIFLNPAYQAGSQYRLDLVIAHEAMRMLGLAPSATRNAILFPSQAANFTGALNLSKDDLAALQSLYPASGVVAGKGSVSGEIIDGETGNKIPGAHVELIPLSKIQLFADTAERKLAETGAFSRGDGVFKIENVSPGDYVIIFESLKGLPISKSLWDDWIYLLGSDLEFSTEFYDGAERESNHEGALTFSPQLVFAAAIITVQAGQDTSNVQLITNTANQAAPPIVAPGSSNEQLPQWEDISKRLADLNQEAAAPEEKNSPLSGGGCSLRVQGAKPEKDSFEYWVGLILAFVGIYFCLRPRGSI